jgi:hypothetical protein
MNLTDGNLIFGIIWAALETFVIIGGGIKFFNKMTRRLDKIEYILLNDGKTGLVNKVDSLVENQQYIKTEIEVIKAKAETNGY